MSDIAKEQSENGVAAVLFNFAYEQKPGELTVLKEAEDLKAVIGGVRTLSFIDGSKVFLWGHSFGGLVASYVGCRFPDEIRGMVLAEPAYALKDQIKNDYPDLSAVPASVYSKGFIDDLYSFDIYDYMAAFKGNVVIFLGTTNSSAGTVSPEYFDRAAKLYPAAELVRIEGANHSFQPKGWDELIKGTTEFLKKNI
jgi:pimeloyl-ACP methyl ester carboxylesterase